MIINGENLILGRLATKVAKEALLGNNVDIVNCDKIVIVGKKKFIEGKYSRIQKMGTPRKGPFLSRMPDRFVRRVIRGMIPYKKGRGKDAFKRVMCYMGVPDKFKNEKIETFDNINVLNTKNINYISIKRICQLLGRHDLE